MFPFIAFLDRSPCSAHSPSISFEFVQFLTDWWSFEKSSVRGKIQMPESIWTLAVQQKLEINI
jgi:hypothetical protein